MRLKLVLGFVIAAAAATSAVAENWQPVPGEPDTYVDADYTKVDQKTGLVVLRTLIGKPPGGVYANWPEDDRAPISVFAVDCAADAYKDLGLDFEDAAEPPADWRAQPSQPGATFAVGGAGVGACKAKDSLPIVALP